MSRHSGHIYRDITGFFILIPVGILFVNSKKKTVSKQRLGEVGKGGLSEGVARGNDKTLQLATAMGCFTCHGFQRATRMGKSDGKPICGR